MVRDFFRMFMLLFVIKCLMFVFFRRDFKKEIRIGLFVLISFFMCFLFLDVCL